MQADSKATAADAVENQILSSLGYIKLMNHVLEEKIKVFEQKEKERIAEVAHKRAIYEAMMRV